MSADSSQLAQDVIPASLEDVLASSDDGILLFDLDFRILYANPRARAISRLTDADLNTRTHWEIYPETVGTIVQQTYDEVMQQRVSRTLPDYFYAPFELWVRVRAIPVACGMAIIYRDVTALTAQEGRDAALRRSEDQLHAQLAETERQRRELEVIYNTSPIGMALYEATELRLLRINHRQCQLFGIRPETSIGKTVYELIPQETARHELMRRAARGEAMLNQRIETPHPEIPGASRHFEVNYSPIFAEEGGVRAVAGVCTEVTHQKLAEKALVESEKLAAVGRMASSIAHEINNPLESVMNLIFLARSFAIAPETQHFLDMADQELRRVSNIANQTLRFHKQASNPRDISCVDLFSTVLSLYEGRLRNSRITVEKRKRAERPVCCFEGDIRQVLNNLVGNAIDAMPNGGRLLVRSREATDWRTGRRGLTLTVADTGGGMSKETQSRIFEAFFTTKGISGTGLGLWISAGIMDRHQGRLLLRSSQSPAHRGTVFTLFLPFESHAVTQS